MSRKQYRKYGITLGGQIFWFAGHTFEKLRTAYYILHETQIN
jgi:hypothetical protein